MLDQQKPIEICCSQNKAEHAMSSHWFTKRKTEGTEHMDPITTAIIAALSAGAVCGITDTTKNVISDSYNKLKGLLTKKFGANRDVMQAVEELEAKPESQGHKQVLQEGQFQRVSLEQSNQLLALQREPNQLMSTFGEIIAHNQFFPIASPSRTLPKVRDNLPPHQSEFFGREKERADILKSLRSHSSPISIEGLGGVGKTTLAIEIAHSCLAGPQAVLDPPFEYVVWVSAKDKPEQEHWLNDVLDIIAWTLDSPSLKKLSEEQIEQKKAETNRLLRAWRTLLIIDNFETIDDPDLETWMHSIPDPSKVLITSRTQLSSTRPIALKGLENPQAVELIRSHAQSLGLDSVVVADEKVLLRLVEVTGGNPKAMSMALGFLKRGKLSLKEVIERLSVASRTVDGVFDNLFGWSWDVMTEDAKEVLLVTSFFVDFVSKEALEYTTGQIEYDLENAVEELVELNLLEIKGESAVVSQRYSIHPLTRAFASAQLAKRQECEKQARARWSQYYLNVATRTLRREELQEPYWSALPTPSHRLLDPERLNLQEVLKWADEQGEDQILVDLMLVLALYMSALMFFRARLDYAQKAAAAARRLGRNEDAALLHIDGRGWILLQEGRLTEAISEITTELRIVQTLDASPKATDLIALGETWLAAAFLEQGNLEEASTRIDKVMLLECTPVIQYRMNLVAGDIAFKKENYAEARNLYDSACKISKLYGGEAVGVGAQDRLGNVYLAFGDFIQAEIYFKELLNIGKEFAAERLPHAYYGFARVARAKGEIEQARQIAQEVLSDLERTVTYHRLSNEIRDFLKNIENIS